VEAAGDHGRRRALDGLFPARTANRDARDLFEQARHLSQQRTLDGYRKAIELLERAVVLDPEFAQAFSLLGMAYANRLGFNVEPTFPAFAQVERAARRALELDPIDGEARALLAVVAYRVEYRWNSARALFQEALRLAPNSTLVHSSFAWALVFNGHFDEAMHHVRLSQELDPLNLGLRASNAAVAMYARRFDFAIREFNTVLQLEPDHLFARVVLGVTYLSMGDPDSAMEHLESIGRAVPGHPGPTFCMVCVDGLRGAQDQGRRRLCALVADLGERHYSRVNLAMAQTCLGDFDEAFASLEHAAEVHDLLFVSVPTHALFAPLRNDPRYPALLQRHGLDPVALPQVEDRIGLRDESPM
jgi:serine/threonine-protein kinase